MPEKLLVVDNLHVQFVTKKRTINAVNGVSFSLNKGEVLGIVGESGSGKSVTSLTVMGLLASPPGKVTEGNIEFDGIKLLDLSRDEMRQLRGNRLAMIFQEPMTSLNPVMTCGDQVAEAIEIHMGLSHEEALKRVLELFKLVGISMPEKRLKDYPHQMSGGLRQRVMIALALSCNPDILIADEPTTALDVTIQAQILELLKSLQEKIGMSVIFITHDLGVTAQVADKVVVMYAGEIVESGTVREIFHNPGHPYTLGLMHSIPQLDTPKGQLQAIEGNVPNPANLPSGCHFHPRCPYATERCKQQPQMLKDIGDGHMVRCWRRTEKCGGETS